MNHLCDSIIDQIDIEERLNIIQEKLDAVRDKQERESSFFGLLFLIITVMTTNLWAQYIYNNTITNYGRGTHYNTDSLTMMLVFTIIALGVIILFSLDIRDVLRI